MTTNVKCSGCGRIIDSTTVTKESFKSGEVIDYGCPYCGPQTPLRAIYSKKKKKERITIEPEPTETPL